MKDKIELELNIEEKVVVNDTLMEHNVGIYELLLRAPDPESQQKAGAMLQGGMYAQHHFVEQIAYGNDEYFSDVVHLLRPVLESQAEKLDQLPDDTSNVLAMAEVKNRITTLKNIVDKLPERPMIQTP